MARRFWMESVMTDAPGTGFVELRGSLTPEYLKSLRNGVEQMRDHNLVLQDVRGEVTLALLDAIQIARTEQESQRARIKELEERRPAHARIARENFHGLAEAAAELRSHAEAAALETDERQPDDRDMLSPKAAKISDMHALLTPAVVLAMLDRIAELEAGRQPAHRRLARDAFPGLAEAVEDANRETLALLDKIAALERTPPGPDKMTPEERAKHKEACLKWLEGLP